MTKKKAKALPVPQTQAEAEGLLAGIGRLQRQAANIERRMNDRLGSIKQRYSEDARPIIEQINEQFTALHAWAEAHRGELLTGRSKTVKLATGELSWRTTPPAVHLRKTEDVLAALHNLKLERFIRTKEEVAKEAILADPDAVEGVKGITISRREEFVAKPFESEIEQAIQLKSDASRTGGGR